MTTPRTIPKYLRIIIPSILLIVWLTISGIGGPLFGKVEEVTSNDQSSFLPASAESTWVNKDVEKFRDQTSIPALIIFTDNDQALQPDQLTAISTVSQKLATIPGLAGGSSPPIPSEDGKAALIVLNMASETSYREFVPEIETVLNDANLPVQYAVSGPVGFLYDLAGAFSGIDGLLLGVALAVVFVILLIVYRSPILPLLVLINSVFALCGALLVVFFLAKAGILTLNGQVQGILFILVIGAATDYALLFVARYREELTKLKEPYKALLASWRRSIEPIAAAGGTIILGLLCLLLSDLSSNKALGPVGAIGILSAMVATLTLLPSLFLMWGRTLFWPRLPLYGSHDEGSAPQRGIWPKVSRLVSTHPRRVWIITTILLAGAAFGITQLRADGVAQSDLILGPSAARDGQVLIDKHFPGGSGTPAQIIIGSGYQTAALTAIRNDSGVASATVVKETTGNPFAPGPAKIVDGTILIEATLTDGADTEAAQATIERLRNSVHNIDSATGVGGAAAVQLDTRTSAEHDRAVVIPAVLVVITIVLMVLLRSILAPILLLASTVLSFAAILGIAALVFNHIFQFPGADPSVVLYAFIFLVALGIDYNIFLMSRVREESLKHGTHKGVLFGLVTTGSVITSAGIVLAATFAALAVIPILFLVQLAFIVALGVLIDTIVVRSLLVPALVYDIGNRVWWPSKKHKK